MLATEPHLGVRPARKYLFFIILCPVGAYYKEGLNPVKIYVEDKYVRAAVGGTGEAKVAGNYAASILAAEEAKAKGFTQIFSKEVAKDGSLQITIHKCIVGNELWNFDGVLETIQVFYFLDPRLDLAFSRGPVKGAVDLDSVKKLGIV
jgi:hypothetical protein